MNSHQIEIRYAGEFQVAVFAALLLKSRKDQYAKKKVTVEPSLDFKPLRSNVTLTVEM